MKAGWVPTVAARAYGIPRSRAVWAASVSRSKTTSMWSEMKPKGATTTPPGLSTGWPSVRCPAARASRWSLTSGSSQRACGGPEREQ